MNQIKKKLNFLRILINYISKTLEKNNDNLNFRQLMHLI